MKDEQIEQEIQAKGLTAPRVTPQRIQEVIAEEHYFTAENGVIGATIDPDVIVANPQPLRLLTFCVLTLQNGFTVTGESACASPENFDAELGRKIARDNAINKVWMLEGYLLKQQLHDQAAVKVLTDADALADLNGEPRPDNPMPPHQRRVLDEALELDGRIEKLGAFLGCVTFETLSDAEQERLSRQLSIMKSLSKVLHERIA